MKVVEVLLVDQNLKHSKMQKTKVKLCLQFSNISRLYFDIEMIIPSEAHEDSLEAPAKFPTVVEEKSDDGLNSFICDKIYKDKKIVKMKKMNIKERFLFIFLSFY